MSTFQITYHNSVLVIILSISLCTHYIQVTNASASIEPKTTNVITNTGMDSLLHIKVDFTYQQFFAILMKCCDNNIVYKVH